MPNRPWNSAQSIARRAATTKHKKSAKVIAKLDELYPDGGYLNFESSPHVMATAFLLACSNQSKELPPELLVPPKHKYIPPKW